MAAVAIREKSSLIVRPSTPATSPFISYGFPYFFAPAFTYHRSAIPKINNNPLSVPITK